MPEAPHDQLAGSVMPNRWEELAREDAEFYIWTDLAPGDDFFQSGERDAARILAFAENFLTGTTTALEIGCGVGRLTIPMSAKFAEITAVDVAPTMLEKLTKNCAARQIRNVHAFLADEPWEQDHRTDFGYSRIVFQHIEAWSVIADYFRRIAIALKAGGLLYVQFDTRRPNILYHLRNRLPDAILPRTSRRGVRRIRRTAPQIIDLAARCGLELLQDHGRGSLDHEFLFRRTMP
jgi:SAM-dependent methyltransferase